MRCFDIFICIFVSYKRKEILTLILIPIIMKTLNNLFATRKSTVNNLYLGIARLLALFVLTMACYSLFSFFAFLIVEFSK